MLAPIFYYKTGRFNRDIGINKAKLLFCFLSITIFIVPMFYINTFIWYDGIVDNFRGYLFCFVLHSQCYTFLFLI